MNLARNVGSTDKMIRLVAGVLLLALGIFGIGLGGAGGILVSLVGCHTACNRCYEFLPSVQGNRVQLFQGLIAIYCI